MPANELPTGRVTFAFTDVVGSTRLLAEYGNAYVAAQDRLQTRIAAEAKAHHGVVVKTQGDGTFLAFPVASDAVNCLRAIQAGEEHADPPHVRVRGGMHIGEGVVVGDDYVSLAVHVAARVSSAARAGQVLASSDVIDALPAADGVFIGEFDLKDVAQPMALWRLAGDDAAPQAQPTRRTNVAVSRTSFFGRADQIEDLRLRLREPGLVSLVGTGGVGKTRLVSEFALAEDAVNGFRVLLVELASADQASGAIDAIASTVSCTPSLPAVCAALAERGDIVLVLDNCEHLLDAIADCVIELRDRCPQLRILATSREPIAVAGEQVMRLRPLSPDAAHELFLSRAQSAGADLWTFDLDLVTRICEELEGLPLGLELAAVQSGDMPLAWVADAVNHADLVQPVRGGPQRQRSLEALVSWSVDRLDEADRAALIALSVLPGSLDIAIASNVLPNDRVSAAQRVAGLCRSSLVDLDGDHYRLLFVIREVVRQHPDATAGQLDAAAARLHAFCESWIPADPVELQIKVTSDPAYTNMIRPLLEQSMEWSLDQGREPSEAIFSALRCIFRVYGSAGRMIHIFQRLAVRELNPPTPEGIRVAAYALRLQFGGVATVGGSESQIELRYAELEALAIEAGDPHALAVCAAARIRMLQHSGDFDGARAAAAEAIAYFESRDPLLHYLMELDLAVIDHVEGRPDKSAQRYEQMLRREVSQFNLDLTVVNYAEDLLDLGRAAQAADVLTRALQTVLPTSGYAVEMRGYLAEALYALGRRDDARTLMLPVLEEYRELCKQDDTMYQTLARFEALPLDGRSESIH